MGTFDDALRPNHGTQRHKKRQAGALLRPRQHPTVCSRPTDSHPRHQSDSIIQLQPLEGSSSCSTTANSRRLSSIPEVRQTPLYPRQLSPDLRHDSNGSSRPPIASCIRNRLTAITFKRLKIELRNSSCDIVYVSTNIHLILSSSSPTTSGLEYSFTHLVTGVHRLLGQITYVSL